MASRFKLWDCCRSFAWIMASNPSGVMDISLLSVVFSVGSYLCVQGISSIGVLPRVSCLSVMAKHR